MKNKVSVILFLILTLVLCISCKEDKRELDNPLAGQWQLTEWVDAAGIIVATNETQMYYSFQLQMMMFQKLSVSSGYLLSSFEHKMNSIRIYDPVKYRGNGHDEILSMDTLGQYGVPLDGVMMIEKLADDTLILYSKETGRLSFRKY